MRIIISISLILLFTNFSGCEKKDPLISGEVKGIVKDYTGLDGCGFIIELTNGEKLEPVQMADTGFVFYDGQRVLLTYTELTDYGSFCMVGKIVRIETIRETGCIPFIKMNDFSGNLPNDLFVVDTLTINGDCLDLVVSYSGGCKTHKFQLNELPTLQASPQGPLPVLLLSHNANNDMCEAYITDFISFDLSGLQVLGGSSTVFILRLNYEGSGFSKMLTYYY